MSTEPNPQTGQPDAGNPLTKAPAPSRRRSKWLPLIGFIGILVAGGVLAWFAGLRPTQEAAPVTAVAIRTVPVTTGTLEKTIRVSGVTSSIVFANVRAPVQRGPERQTLILLGLLPSGTMVKKGDVIGEIDGQGLADHIDDVQSTVDTSIADIKKRRAEQQVDWNNLEQSLRLARANAEKWELEAGAAEIRTVIDREILSLGVEEAKAAFEQKGKDLNFKESVHDAEIKILEYTTERHRRHVARHAYDLERYTVEAPMDGMVVRQQIFRNGEFGMAEVGDRLWPGLLFVKVMDTNNMQVEGVINQVESEELRIGMEARVGLDAFPEIEFPGRVYSIGALAKAGVQAEYVREIPVRVEIDGAHPKLIPDLSSYADVVLDRQENATIAPLAAIFEEAGQEYVFVKNGESFEKRPVELGMRNFTHVAVLSGLQDGEEVALENPAG